MRRQQVQASNIAFEAPELWEVKELVLRGQVNQSAEEHVQIAVRRF